MSEEAKCVLDKFYYQVNKNDMDKKKIDPNEFIGSQGQLKMKYKNGTVSYIGSGMVFIAKYPDEILNKQYVLTVAHNFFKKGTNIEFTSVNFSFRKTHKDSCDVETQLIDWYIYDKYYESGDDPVYNDFAFAVCEIDLNDRNLLHQKNIYIEEVKDEMKGKTIYVIGYPGDNPHKLCWMEGTIADIEWKDFGDEKAAKIVYKDLNTWGGSSGSPVYLEHNDGSLSIIGVHHGGEGIEETLKNPSKKIDPYNMAAGITSQKLAWMSEKIEELKRKRQ